MPFSLQLLNVNICKFDILLATYLAGWSCPLHLGMVWFTSLGSSSRAAP